MKRIDEFRLFYNHTIHPELLRLEKHRLRLLWLLFASALLLLALIAFQLYIRIFVVFMLLFIPLTIYISWVIYRIRQFKLTYKPQVVRLVLDFIDNKINYDTLYYNATQFIPKQRFLDSRIFLTDAPEYSGEDRIEGKIGQIDFVLCELNVREYSPVRSRLNYVFRGVFMHAKFPEPKVGQVLILPENYQAFLFKSIKAFTRTGGREVESELHNEDFQKIFMTYATNDADIQNLLSEDVYKRQAYSIRR